MKQKLSVGEVLKMNQDFQFFTWTPQKSSLERIAVAGGKGCYFWDFDGKKYLDAGSQLVNLNIGFQDERVVKAIKDQADELCYIAPSYATEIRGRLAKKIITDCAPGMGKVMFTLGGADANEYALRISNGYTNRYKVFSQYMSYHGSTYGASNLNGQVARGNIDPGIAGFVHFIGPWWRDHGIKFENEEEYSAFLLRMLERQMIQEGPDKISCLFTESMQGGGGVIPMPKGYMKGLRDLCTKYGILMVCDEVMVGFGRTGKWFTYQHYGIQPDIITFAKGSTCGYTPLGGVIVSKDIAKYYDDVALPAGLTYNSHPICCAASLAVIGVYEEDNLLKNSEERGKELVAGLKELVKKHKSAANPRGLGLHTAIDLVGGAATGASHVKLKNMYIDNGVIPYILPPRIVLSPPLIVTQEEIQKILEVTDKVLTFADTLV
jgi:taurine--2-oxoglutarate transaminase